MKSMNPSSLLGRVELATPVPLVSAKIMPNHFLTTVDVLLVSLVTQSSRRILTHRVSGLGISNEGSPTRSL